MLASAYLYGLSRVWRRLGRFPIEPWRFAMTCLGLITVFIAVQGPLHDLSENYLLSAHMVQHLMLQFVMPPLILLGTPGVLLSSVLKPNPVIRVLRVCVHPLGAFILFNAVLVGWHLPPLYDFALEHHNVHISQHISFMFVGLIAWWPLVGSLEALPRPHPSVQMLYLFAQSIPMGFLGAIITFASEPIYTFYARGTGVWGISVLTDQQIGGLIMKSASGIVLIAVLAIIFFKWFSDEETVRTTA
jgi:putative membrane protein